MTVSFPIPALACNNAPRRSALELLRVRRKRGVPKRSDDCVEELPQQDMARLMEAVASARDVDAFERLFRHYGPRVRAFMMRQCRDGQMADELMQETMMTVWNKAGLFYSDRGTVDAWIFTVARNLRTSAFRKAKRPVFDPTDPVFVPDDPLEPGDHLERIDDAERLRRAMEDLPPEQLEVLKYAFFDEISHRKLAEKLNLPVGTIKSRIRMAFGKLRKALEDAE